MCKDVLLYIINNTEQSQKNRGDHGLYKRKVYWCNENDNADAHDLSKFLVTQINKVTQSSKTFKYLQKSA